MTDSTQQQTLLRQLPGVDRIRGLVEADPALHSVPAPLLVRSIRKVIEDLRSAILASDGTVTEQDLTDSRIRAAVNDRIETAMALKLKPTINATGVVIHTNLGRSRLAAVAVENLVTIASKHSNLEFDLSTGKRGSRYDSVEDLLCEISGAESAMVVNNNAGAVLLCLDTISRGRKVIVSRGELVEIGGSFRIPAVMEKSGSILREVGATNRTHLKDYEEAIENETALLLKVHTSNYSVVGFTADVTLEALVGLGETYQIPVMEDLGSGTFVDFSRYGLSKEPTVQEAVATGVDVVTFSGDKLLGGPQAGIILGKREHLDAIKKNPLTRALRIDKMTLAALESTLRLYRDPEEAVAKIPTLRMLTMDLDHIDNQAEKLANMLRAIDDTRLTVRIVSLSSKAGGGSLPLLELPSKCVGVTIADISPNAIDRSMRQNRPSIIGRIEEDAFIMDLRTLEEDELAPIGSAFAALLTGTKP